MWTAENLTDEAIRELRQHELDIANGCRLCLGAGAFVHARKGDARCTACMKPRERAGLCSLALGDTSRSGIVQAAARARIAELLNARAASVTGFPGYTAKVDELFAHCNGFGVRDFVDLAIAALDQAGIGERDQVRIRSMVVDLIKEAE